MPAKEKAKKALKKTEMEMAKAGKAVERGGRNVEGELKKGGSAIKKDAKKLRRKL